MKLIIDYKHLFFLIYFLSTISAIFGQPDPIDIPFRIDVKKNINNIKAINLSDIGKELLYIPLESTPACLINEINDIEFSDSYIFINETKRLLQFDKSGKFIRQIGSQGRGPEEYIAVTDFCIDNQSKEIYIIAYGKRLVFGFDGHFIKSFSLSIRPFQIIIKDHNSLMYHLPNISGPKVDNRNSWIITDRQEITLKIIKNQLLRVSQPGLIIGDTPLYLFNNSAHFMEFGIDTLYYFFHDTDKKPYAIFILENLKMDIDPLITSSNKEEVGEKLFGKLWINSIYENNDFLFIKFFRGISDSVMCAIFNKKTAVVTILKDNVFRNDLNGGTGFWPKQIINDSILVDYMDAFDLLKSIKQMQSEARTKKDKKFSITLSNLSKQITETSNPILMILK